jgi:hypothetical protein
MFHVHHHHALPEECFRNGSVVQNIKNLLYSNSRIRHEVSASENLARHTLSDYTPQTVTTFQSE